MKASKAILVGLAGVGTVGRGTVNILKHNAEEIERRLGQPLKLYAVADQRLDEITRLLGGDVQCYDNIFDLLKDPQIDIVIELIGGTDIALQFLLEAIKAGKHVVTANKALLANYGKMIFEAAEKKGVMVGFEASVAGGIPIIKALKEGLAANRIESVYGIINGTSNYILTAMRDKKICFQEALSCAQQLGYAESDPTFDIQGYDAAHKITLLASLAFGVRIAFEDCYVEGIETISALDMDYAKELGYEIKSLAITRRVAHQIQLRVHPTLIPIQTLLAHVDGVMNAVLVNGNMVGQTLHYGPGAGSLPTASAVVADLMDIVRRRSFSLAQYPALGFLPRAIEKLPVMPIHEILSAYYLRIKVANHAGVLGDITHQLGNHQVSIEALIQKSTVTDDSIAQIVILTTPVKEKLIRDALLAIDKLSCVVDKTVYLRVERF